MRRGDGTVDSECGAHWVRKCGIGPLCHKMRMYRPTVQVRGEMRLDSTVCTVDGEGVPTV